MLNTEKILGIETLVLDEKDFYILLIGLLVLLLIDLGKGKIHLRTALLQQNIIFRWICYYAIIMVILIFGIYGPEFDASTFIYFQF